MNEQLSLTGKIIAEARKKHGYTQESLAEALNVSRQAVSRWESGSAYPETEKLVRLSMLLELDLNYLLKGESQTAQTSQMNSDNTLNPDVYGITGLINNLHYEYKSKHKLFGLPLIHINIGIGPHRAKGIIAVGVAATGLISIGLVSAGMFSFGLATLGLLAIGIFSLGCFSAGAVTIGMIAVGAVAVGIMTFGAVSVGGFAFGALSVGGYVAVGEHAYGGITIAMTHANGSILTIISESDSVLQYNREEVISAIDQYVPKFWILFISICKALL